MKTRLASLAILLAAAASAAADTGILQNHPGYSPFAHMSDGLYHLYLQEFRSIANDGDLSQCRLGFVNAVGNSYCDEAVRPASPKIRSSGIAAFVFPLNTNR